MDNHSTALKWESVTALDDLIGLNLQIEEGSSKYRGPIASIRQGLSGVAIRLQWAARKQGDASWQAWSYDYTYTFKHGCWQLAADRDGTEIKITLNPSIMADAQDVTENSLICRIFLSTDNHLDPASVVGLPQPIGDKSRWTFPRVEMSDDDWQALCVPPPRMVEIDTKLCNSGQLSDDEWRELERIKETVFPALPVCCGNDGTLRETIEDIYKNSGFVWPAQQHDLILQYWGAVAYHEIDWTILNKVIDQVRPGWSVWVRAVMDLDNALGKASSELYTVTERQAALKSAHELIHSHILEISRGFDDSEDALRSTAIYFWVAVEKLGATLPTAEQGKVFEFGVQLLICPEATLDEVYGFCNRLEAAGIYVGLEFDDTTPFHDALRDLRGGVLDDDELDEPA